MPKMKTHSGMKKRIKVTGTGKFRFKRTGARHRMIGNSNRNKRAKRGLVTLEKSFEDTLRKMLPYA